MSVKSCEKLEKSQVKLTIEVGAEKNSRRLSTRPICRCVAR